MQPTATNALEELSRAENFRSWDFDRIAKSIATAEASFGFMPEVTMPSVNDPRWRGEPDKVQWIDPDTGYDCLIVRNPMGALCGYVGVPPEHSWHGKDPTTCLEDCGGELWCDHSPSALLSVHGGITFFDFCDPSESDETICHVAAPGRPEKVFWFGFDCGHAWDYQPGLHMSGLGINAATYRDLGYVVSEVRDLAVQLKAMA